MSFTYKLQKREGETEASSVTKYITGTNECFNIGFNPESSLYQEYLEWVAAGNTAEAAD